MHLVRPALSLVMLLAPSERTVELRTFRYRDAVVEVVRGDAVRWTNRDRIAHTVTEGTPDRPGLAFDGVLDGEGGEFVHRFDRPGTYPYFCARHRFMRGEVRVVPTPHGAS